MMAAGSFWQRSIGVTRSKLRFDIRRGQSLRAGTRKQSEKPAIGEQSRRVHSAGAHGFPCCRLWRTISARSRCSGSTAWARPEPWLAARKLALQSTEVGIQSSIQGRPAPNTYATERAMCNGGLVGGEMCPTYYRPYTEDRD